MMFLHRCCCAYLLGSHLQVSPADGRILHFGEIDKDKVEQVKGMTYSLDALLGASGTSAEPEKSVDIKRAGKVVDGAWSMSFACLATVWRGKQG